MSHTPWPWTWGATNTGQEDEYGNKGVAPIDINTYQSPGYCDNATLYAPNMEDDILGCGGEYNIIHGTTPEERVANANLIAAAPLLLEVLEELEDKLGRKMISLPGIVHDTIKKAIEKAKGEPFDEFKAHGGLR